MKKNKMMRLASAMMVMTLLTTSVISGTFAKYVTSDSAKDVARVAKWGVVVTAEGTLFGKTYLNASANTPGADDADPDTITVKSINTQNVVAPGTKNADGITAVVSGTPEVDVKVVVEVKGLKLDGTEEETVKDIYLLAGNYPDMTTGDATDKIDYTDYYPVKFTLKQNSTTLVNGGKLSEVETALENLSATYNANTNLAEEVGTLKLTWEWAYGTAADTDADPWALNVELADKADTLLGNLAVDSTIIDASNYNLETGLELSILVEQID